MFFSRRREKEALVLLLDLQSSIVRGSLVVNGKVPRIICTYSRNIPFKPDAGSAYLIKATLKLTEEVVEMVLRDLHMRKDAHPGFPGKIEAVHYALSSPWIVSEAKTISMKFKKETTISDSMIREVIEKERSKQILETGDRVALIEEKVFDVKLNGYSVPVWDKKKADNISVSYVSSIAGTHMVSKLKSVCRHAVSMNRVHFHSSLLLQNIGIQALFPDSTNYILIHVHGELTDVLINEDHSCVFFGSYPMGVRTILRKVSGSMKIDELTGESMLTLHQGGHIEADRKQALVIGNIAEGWSAEFSKLLKKGNFNMPLPKEAIITARTHEDFFADCFKKSHPECKIRPLTVDSLKDLVIYEESERFRLTGFYAVAIHMLSGK